MVLKNWAFQLEGAVVPTSINDAIFEREGTEWRSLVGKCWILESLFISKESLVYADAFSER